MVRLAEFIKEQWDVLTMAPGVFFVLSVMCVAGGFAGGFFLGQQIYSSQFESLKAQLAAREDQIARYRVALGVDKASQGALVELTNEELQLKAFGLSEKIRSLANSMLRRADLIGGRNSTIENAESKLQREQIQSLWREVVDRYNRDLRADRALVTNEILKRLDRKAVASVVRVPFHEAETGAPISILSVVVPSFGDPWGDSLMMIAAADETEQLAKLLPTTRNQQSPHIN